MWLKNGHKLSKPSASHISTFQADPKILFTDGILAGITLNVVNNNKDFEQ